MWGRTHEFLVARTTGQNIWQALMPVIATVFIFGLFHITIINPIAAASAKQYDYLLESIFGRKTSQNYPFQQTASGCVMLRLAIILSLMENASG